MNTSIAANTGFARFGEMKILIVDDEPSNVVLLEAMLREHGYTCVESITDSSLALETCAVFDPDLVVLDLLMPQPDGFAILEALRLQDRPIFLPVMILTADITEQARCRALAAGATDFLLKPFNHTEVLLRIGNMLEMRRLHLRLDNQRAAFEDAVYARTSELRDVQSQLRKVNFGFPGECLSVCAR